MAKNKHHAFFGTATGRTLLRRLVFENDIKDSANVADLLSQGKCLFYERPDEKLVELRTLLALRRRLCKEAHRLRMQIRNGLVAKHFPELDRFWSRNLDESLAIVRWCLDPRSIAAMPFEDFVRRVTKRDNGLKQRQRLKAIYETAAGSIGCPMGNAARFEARLLVERFKRKQEQIDEVMKRIEKVCKQFPAYANLLTIPGFGPFVSALVLATIGDPIRFGSRKQVLRLAGLDLNASRSGKRSSEAVPVLSKRGNADFRYALFQAAMIASFHNDRLRALFNRYLEGRVKERGIKTKMRVKLAAKLLVAAWTMMKNGTRFDPELIAC